MEVTEALQKCVPGGGIRRQKCLWKRGEQYCWGGVNLLRGVDRDEFMVENCKPETERWQFREHLACPWPGWYQAVWENWVDLPLLPVKGVIHGWLWLFLSWLLCQNFACSVGTASSPRWDAEGSMSCSSAGLTLVNLPDGYDALGAGKG